MFGSSGEEASAGMTVLDLGTGSGILAIASARLGASSVLALDTDSNAVYAAKNNVKSNFVENIVKIKRGTLSLRAQRELQVVSNLVVANILSEVVANFAKGFASVLNQEVW